MFKHKNALIAIAVAALIAACGGGGGGDNNPGGGGDTSGGSHQNPPGNNDNRTVTDNAVANPLALAQVMTTTEPNATNGIYDVAFLPTGLYGQPEGANGSPLKVFGLKLLPEKSDAGASGNGHVAFEVKKADNSQQFQIAIDQVNYTITPGATGEFQATVPNTAKAYVHVKNGTNVADLVLDNLPSDVVKVISGFNDDPSYRGLIIDIEKLFDAAIAKATADAQKAAVDSVKDWDGEYTMNATYSALNIVRSGAPSAGADITVEGSNQPAIKGTGVQGKLYLGAAQPPGV